MTANTSFFDPNQIDAFIVALTALIAAVSGLIAAIYSIMSHRQGTTIQNQTTAIRKDQVNGAAVNGVSPNATDTNN